MVVDSSDRDPSQTLTVNDMNYVVAAFYHFFSFPACAKAQRPLLDEMKRLEIKGSLLIAPEGINGTLAGTREAIDTFLNHLRDEFVHGPFEHKESFCETQPFARSKVRLKREIIAMGEFADPNVKTGQYVSAQEWNDLVRDPEVVLLDARNRYEVHVGTFEGAIDPDTRTFKQLPEFVRQNLDPAKHKKVATYCTGGIRCEKFTAWLLDQGFENVYHLKGGILKYLEEIPPEDSTWQGECYVFDQRIAVGHGLVPSDRLTYCRNCGHPLTGEDRVQTSFDDFEPCRFCEREKGGLKE
jgi:UPF0176 protein